MLRGADWVLLGAILGLAALGVALVYSSTVTDEPGRWVGRQVLWIALGLAGLLAAQFVPVKTYDILAYPLYGLALLLLVLVLALHGGGGTARWMRIGPLQVQPSELAKPAVVFALARYLADRRRPRGFRAVLVPIALVGVPMLLVARQPDLGTAIVFGATLFPMLFWAGLEPLLVVLLFTPLASMVCAASLVSWVLFVGSLLAVVYFGRLRRAQATFVLVLNFTVGILTPLLWGHLEQYQKNRILSYLSPDKDPLGAGYQILQSKVAIGSGGAVGKGFLEGTQKELKFLPAGHTDFVFSVAGEEFGLVGAVVILALFLVVIWRGLRIARDAKEKFASLTAVGITFILLFHVCVNVGMTVGLFPVTGLPLPLLSYGGSSCLVFLTSVGILVAIGRSRRAA